MNVRIDPTLQNRVEAHRAKLSEEKAPYRVNTSAVVRTLLQASLDAVDAGSFSLSAETSTQLFAERSAAVKAYFEEALARMKQYVSEAKEAAEVVSKAVSTREAKRLQRKAEMAVAHVSKELHDAEALHARYVEDRRLLLGE